LPRGVIARQHRPWMMDETPGVEDELRALRARVAELESRDAIYRAVVSSAPIGLGVADDEGEFVVWNDAMLAVSGYRPDEQDAWLAARHTEAARATRRRMLDGARQQGGLPPTEVRIPRPDGSVADAVVTVSPIAHGRERYWHITLQDVTELKRVERALRESEEQLREAQKMEAVGQLAGGVAHDFNNLLTVITGNVTLLLHRADLAAPYRDELREVEQAAMRGGELTKKLLGFSRRALLSLAPIDLRNVARETASLLRRTFDPRVKVVVEESNEPCTVLADVGEMSQVLLNLCLNSRDAMPEGGRLLVRTRTRLVSEEHARLVIDARPGEAVCLTVEDTGHGIPEPIRSRVFEPFFTTKQPGAGTGLGLAMVFGIVKQHQGWIELSSDPSQGSRFDIFLPRHVAADASAGVATLSTPRSQKRETILVVDDEEAVRRLAGAILTEHGYRVLLAEDGPSALHTFEQRWREIDLVILDLRMPYLSGRDTLHGLWRIHPDARVVISSGHADEHERVAAAEPVAGSLAKPYGFDELVQSVREALEREPARA
jgi:two-component system cell cycle sensor histidine kinase/response regulator CckA